MTMPVAPEAILQDQEGRPMLRFERRLPHPPERVWRALTETDELSAWHPSPPEFELEVGGTVRFTDSAIAFPDGEVTDCDPPRTLGYTWGDDHLRWELEPLEDGCLLVLLHSFDDRFKAARDAAGWDLCLDSLSSLLAGEPAPPSKDPTAQPREWQELNSAYEKRFGIPPERATPPPEL
jgi:uncharacterized protein YndB with AHSA1/START domain